MSRKHKRAKAGTARRVELGAGVSDITPGPMFTGMAGIKTMAQLAANIDPEKAMQYQRLGVVMASYPGAPVEVVIERLRELGFWEGR